MTGLNPEDRRKVLAYLARSLSFERTLAAFPGLTSEELRGILLDAARGMEPGETRSELPLHRQPSSPEVTIYIDGASSGNPGPAGIGVVIVDQQGKVRARLSRAIGHATNNVAEYRALIEGLTQAKRMGANHVKVLTDSELLARQMEGRYRVRAPHLKALWSRAVSLLRDFSSYQIFHIPREKNKEADKLAKGAIERCRR